jgi:hypothetical protein
MNRGIARLGLLAAAACALAYQYAPDVAIPADGLLATWTYEGFYGAEGDARWSAGDASILVPDPGAGVEAQVELRASGWRPRRIEPPVLHAEVPGAASDAPLGREEQVVALRTRFAGLWDSSARVLLRCPTFVPGPQDPRALGASVTSLSLSPVGARIALRRPPLREVALSLAFAILLGALLARLGCARVPLLAEAAIPALVALAFAFARPYAVLLGTPALGLLALVLLLALALPSAVRRAAAFLAAMGAAALAGIGELGAIATPVLAVLGIACLWAATARTRDVDIDVGSGREDGVVSGFGPYEGTGGVTFREVRRGAVLDLRPLGEGGTFDVSITASRPGHPGPFAVAWPGGGAMADAGEEWTTSRVSIAPRGLWDSGLVLSFPGAAGVRVDRVEIARSGGRPSLHLLVLALLGAGLGAAAVGAAGLRGFGPLGVFVLALGLMAVGLARDPLVFAPYLPTVASILGLALLLGSLLAAWDPPLPAGVLVASVLGFAGWVLSTASPLYRGGHFVFHSSIAEEIWKGRFLIYYLPYPGSMLSRQAQWGDIVVPHPCLYHTLVAPLAALPRALFYFSEKCVLALMLSALVLTAGWLGVQFGNSARAGTWSAAVAASLVPPVQLLGLGHLMTILGVSVMAVTTAALVVLFPDLERRRAFWLLTGLFTLCFLSYTAGLLFEVCVVLWSLPFLARRYPRESRALLGAFLAASALAFLLYYVNWAWPFLRESVPRIVRGGAGQVPHHVSLLSRLRLLPGKLDYSYGSRLVPLVGLAGLGLLLPRGPARVFLWSWGAVLVVFSGLDLSFNLLLKHHYFTETPVALGIGLALARVEKAGSEGRAVAILALLGILAFAVRTALAIASGGVP